MPSYLTVSMNHQYWKFLHFIWKGTVFKFNTLPFGLATAPITFTKLLRPVAASLRSQGIRLLIYLDDILLAAQTSDMIIHEMSIVTNLLESLGFTLNQKKCILSPSQNLEFLGFQIDTITMSLSLPPDKVQKIRKECHHCLHMSRTNPRQLAHLIGLMTSTSPAVLPAPLHYRMLQMLRSQALLNHQSYNTPIPWTREAYQDLEWWVDQMSSYNSRQIMPKQAEVHLESDASKKGWGHTAEPHRKGQEDCGASKTRKLISMFWNSRQLSLPFNLF